MNLTVFDGKKILVTGASGLLGRALVSALLTYDSQNPPCVVALVRNIEKAKKVFNDLPQARLNLLVCDICELAAEDMGVDYIIHCASHTASKDFVARPVEVISNSINGTKRVLDFAVKNNVESVVYLSTMEVYGTPSTDEKIYESSPTNLNSMKARSSYPESKRLCECLCASYFSEYGVPVKVVRLTQTFGEGVVYDDGRLFAELARCALENRDIVLNTKGETKRNYLYIGDAVEAIFTVLLKGVSGEAYNAADEQTYCSVYEMACMVAENFGNGIRVLINEAEDISRFGYAPTLKMNLSAQKLQALGFTAKTHLKESFEKMFEYMRKHKK